MPKTKLWLLGELANALDVEFHTVRDLVRVWGITPCKVPHSPGGKGLNLEQVIVVCRALNRPDVIERFREQHESESLLRMAHPSTASDFDIRSPYPRRPR